MTTETTTTTFLTRKRLLIGVAILLFALLVVLVVVLSGADTAASVVPPFTMTIDGVTVPPEKLGYFYGLAVNQYINEAYQYWGDEASGIIQFSLEGGVASLQSQPCPLEGYQDKMWSDFFVDKAAQTLFEVSLMAQAAESAGLTLDESDIDEIEQQLDEMQAYLKSEAQSVSQHLSDTFGPGVTLEWVRQMMETTSLVAKYANQLAEELEATPEEPEAYYGAMDGLLAGHSYELIPG